MRKAVLILLFVSSPVFASNACETALTTSVAKVTEKAIDERVLNVEEIAELVAAKEPFNPLRYRTLGSMNASLSRFYLAMIAKHQTDGDWELVRAELARVLAKHAVAQGQVNSAKEETQIIPIFTREDEISGIRARNLTWYGMSDGRMLYYYFLNGKTIVRELGQKEIVGIVDGSGWVRENALGNPEFITVSPAKKNLGDWIKHPSLSKETLSMLDLKTNVTTEFPRFYGGENGATDYILTGHKPGSEIVMRQDSLFSPLVANKPYVRKKGERHVSTIRYNGHTGFALQAVSKHVRPGSGLRSYKFIYFADGGWQEFNSQPVVLFWSAEKIRAFSLKDESLAILAIDAAGKSPPLIVMPFKGVPQKGFYLNTSHNNLDQIDLQQTFDDRVLVVTESRSFEERDFSVEVFEPGVDEKPLFKVSHNVPVKFAAFTREKHFYVLIEANGEMLLYEPLSSTTPLQRVVLPGFLQGVFTDKQGEPFLIKEIGKSSLTFHRIFGPG